MISSYLSLGLPSGLFPSYFTIKTPYTFPSFQGPLHATTLIVLLDYPNYIWRGLQIKELHNIFFFQSPVTFSLRPTNTAPHTAMKHPLPTQETKSHTHAKKQKKKTVLSVVTRTFSFLVAIIPKLALERLYPKVNGEIPAGRKTLMFSRQVSTKQILPTHQ